MVRKTNEKSAAEFLPDKRDLKHLREAAAGCQGCDLYAHANQTVFGEGSTKARIFLVGEQPGGATAAQATFGSSFKITQSRGEFLQSDLAPIVMATVHPSSILRATDHESRELAMASFIADVSKIPEALERSKR